MAAGDLGKKDGSVRLHEYKSEYFLRKLDDVVLQLREDLPEANYDRKSFSLLIGNMLQFMEDALGKNALPPKPFPKLPAKLLRDYSVDGSLYAVGVKCHALKVARGLEKWEWQSPAKRKQNLEILSNLKSDMEKRGFMATPKICVHPSCGSETPKLKTLVKEMGGTLASSEDSPGITHIVYPFGPDGDPDDGVQYLRSLEKRDDQAFVHWWYLPDSYDEWISSATAPEGLEPDHGAIGPWKVYLRWLVDSHRFNEWMNPIDYETEEFQDEQERLRKEAQEKKESSALLEVDDMDLDEAPTPATDDKVEQEKDIAAPNAPETEAQGKRKRETPEENLPPAKIGGNSGGEDANALEGDDAERQTKRSRPDEPESRPEIDDSGGEKISSIVTKQKVIQPHERAMDGSATVENISQGQLPPVRPGMSPRDLIPVAEYPPDALPPDVQPPNPAKKHKEMYRVPAYACWFDWNKINDLERQIVPEFFNGRSASKTPKVYKGYRDFIMNKYRENPKRRLTFTEVRKQLTGDVNGIYRVFNFLDNWGLINYMAEKSNKEQSQVEIAPPSGGPIAAKVNIQDPPPATSSLFQFNQPSMQEGSQAATKGGQANVNLITRRDHFGPLEKESGTSVPVQFMCNAMPWVDCTNLRYHCTVLPDVDLCPQAYAEGRFPPGTSAKDFVRIDRNSEVDASGWSQQDTLLLLEGLELYGDNWTEVAEHVGTKSQLQCVMHFLQLPIEDEFLDQMMQSSQTRSLPAPPGEPHPPPEQQQDEEEDPIPFADAGNPVMAQVAFLAAMVAPKVAAAAAQRALEVLSEEDAAAAKQLEDMTNGGDAGVVPNGSNVHQPDAAATSNGNQVTVGNTGQPTNGISRSRMRVAAATALSAAAVKAKLLAEQEEREIQRHVVNVIDSQLKKLEIKLKYCEELDKALEEERINLRTARQRVDSERQQLRSLLTKASAAQPQTTAPSPDLLTQQTGAAPASPQLPAGAQQAPPMAPPTSTMNTGGQSNVLPANSGMSMSTSMQSQGEAAGQLQNQTGNVDGPGVNETSGGAPAVPVSTADAANSDAVPVSSGV